jgi:hypothetical protein
MSEWKNIEGDVFRFEVAGDCIEGILKGVEDSLQFKNKVYKIETKEGNKTVFGTVVLDQKMIGISVGTEVKIEYTGEKVNKKKGQNAIKLFDVFTRHL